MTWHSGTDNWCQTYSKCDTQAEVTLCVSQGGAHCWPGPPICWGFGNAMPNLKANEMMWSFFQKYHL